MIDFSLTDKFLESIESDLNILGINLSDFFIDHLCYRVDSTLRYNELREELSSSHTLLHEANISGRAIATFKLNEPIKFKKHSIPLLELPSPKEDSKYNEGFEHIECVISESFIDFSNRHPNIEFDWKGAQKAHNAELRIKLGERSIKFHHQSLEEVIKEELK